ncbi:P-loop containing nucleoside triphosphate hydrolases superfamily protein [Perilla frutescens var. hirtella]|nr:P-loop containing nucleoside triphosphate hydrolases superfamily protein [Perilla frutescens var. hirtella]
MERIQVSVRARPLPVDDAKASPWRISGNSIFIPNQPTKFEFDQIFGEDCKTRDVYNARTREIVAAAVCGFNGTVFAYGQTSSGKTHTMRGSKFEPGVIPLAVYDLFDFIQQEMDREFLLRMSYMEIYNEEINDLLAPEHRKLQIHESIERGIFVAGLREEIVASAEQILQLMEFGESHRHVGETNMNTYSSREKTADTEAELSCDAVRVSVLNLVDLAGSERAAKTGAEGVRLKEGSHINKSLMILGTVIKKLSEGAESQGGHVPYRDSKLTRILQPALGGNANTAIICNITLAQIHADETKSSLQFASRALRVTNCAHVNEVLNDAALLKRQKKEIQELRAKLQGLHSEHLEEDILNLRNTLLKSEVERERMALELEEEKRAQAEQEKRLQEQDKKIKNLSSMIFCANREEAGDFYKKAKRRDTWCPGNLGREKSKKLSSVVKENPSEVKSTREDRIVGPLLPFEELVKEASTTDLCTQDKECDRIASEDCTIPAPQALLHVTNRRKVLPRKRNLPMENNDLAELQTEYENLLLEFETHRTTSDIQIDCLTRKLAEVGSANLSGKCRECSAEITSSVSYLDGNKSLRDSDAIHVIKKLQEKITILEMEKSSSQQNFNSVFDLAAEQTISAQEKYEKLAEELMLAREEATLACDRLASAESSLEESDWLTSLLTEAHEIKLEFEDSRNLIESLSSVVDELLNFTSQMPNLILDLRPSVSQSLVQLEMAVKSHEKVESCLRNKVLKLEDEKLALHNVASKHASTMEELRLEGQNSANILMELHEKHEAEKSELLCELQLLLNETSSCSLAKEKEIIRKDLEKTKHKLKDVEFKLKNAVQEKTKLEGEKSYAERELKRLQSQNAMLERDMNKRESVIGRRHDSTIDRSSNVFDQKRPKAVAVDVEAYRNLEVLAFEMETKIASLEEQLENANKENDMATSRADSLASDLQALSDKFHLSNSELRTLQEEVSILETSLEESKSHAQEMENTIKSFSEEKLELSMQLSEALLTMEEDRAIWLSKEEASMEASEEKEKLYAAEIASVSEKLSEVRTELEICRKNCKGLEEWATRAEESAASEKQCSCLEEKQVNLYTNEQRASDDQFNRSSETLNLQKSEKSREELEILQLELSVLRNERQCLLAQVQELEGRQPIAQEDSQVLQLKHELEQQSSRLASMEYKMRDDKMSNHKETVKLRMRLRGTQAKLDAFRVRYQDLMDELEFMNRKFEAASTKLKKQLAEYGSEVLNLKKQLALPKGQ